MRIAVIVKEMIEHEFAFSAAIRDFSHIRQLKARCDCTNVIEISGILDVTEIVLSEPGVLRISGKFGDIDISTDELQMEQLRKLLLEGDKNEN